MVTVDKIKNNNFLHRIIIFNFYNIQDSLKKGASKT